MGTAVLNFKQWWFSAPSFIPSPHTGLGVKVLLKVTQPRDGDHRAPAAGGVRELRLPIQDYFPSCCRQREHCYTRKNRKLVTRYARTTSPLFGATGKKHSSCLGPGGNQPAPGQGWARSGRSWVSRQPVPPNRPLGHPEPPAQPAQPEARSRKRIPRYWAPTVPASVRAPGPTSGRWVITSRHAWRQGGSESVSDLLGRDVTGRARNLGLSTYKARNSVHFSLRPAVKVLNLNSYLDVHFANKINQNTNEPVSVSLKKNSLYKTLKKILKGK